MTVVYLQGTSELPQLWLGFDLKLRPTIVGVARDICVELGKRIRLLRKERRWRQIDLAESAGISENYVSDIENGRKEICIRTLQTVAKALGVTVGELLKGV